MKRFLTAMTVLATLGTFNSCSALPPRSDFDETATSRRAAHLEDIREAIARADPRITGVDPVDQSFSGVTTRYGVTVFVRGQEPIRPETLRAILSAIDSRSPASRWTAILFVVDDDHLEPVDTTGAAESILPGAWVSIGSQLAITQPGRLFEND